MPKKSAAARGGAQRNKPKVQKNIELVHPKTTSEEQTLETSKTDETDNNAEQAVVVTSVDTMVAPKARSVSTSTTRTRSTNVPKVRETSARLATSTAKKEEKEAEEQEEVSEAATIDTVGTTGTSTAPKSAAARLAARRQSGQKNRAARGGITHYRRALFICTQRPGFHRSIGGYYVRGNHHSAFCTGHWLVKHKKKKHCLR